MPLPLLGIAATASLGSAAYKGITGSIQQRRARKALGALEGQEPAIEVPAAIRQRVQEPIAVQLMNAQQEAEARRTAQGVGALQKAGAAGILGSVSGLMDSERAAERNRLAGYNQERISALGQMGQAQQGVQQMKMQNYLSKLAAATRSLEAGQQNSANALDTASQFGQQYISGRLTGDIDAPQDEGMSLGYLSKRLKGAPQVNYVSKGLN